MKFPAHFSTIKEILDLTMFGTVNADEIFRSNKELLFTNDFIKYQKYFFANVDTTENEQLQKTCFNYLKQSNFEQRRDIYIVFAENELLNNGLVLLKMMNSKQIKQEAIQQELGEDMVDFLSGKEVSIDIVFLLCEHFLNLRHINPEDFKNYIVDKVRYHEIVTDYLKIQKHVLNPHYG